MTKNKKIPVKSVDHLIEILEKDDNVEKVYPGDKWDFNGIEINYNPFKGSTREHLNKYIDYLKDYLFRGYIKDKFKNKISRYIWIRMMERYYYEGFEEKYQELNSLRSNHYIGIGNILTNMKLDYDKPRKREFVEKSDELLTHLDYLRNANGLEFEHKKRLARGIKAKLYDLLQYLSELKPKNS